MHITYVHTVHQNQFVPQRSAITSYYNVSQMGSARLHNAIITSNSEHYQMSCSLGIPHCTRCSAGYEGLLCLLEEGKSYNIFVQAQLAMQHGLYDIYRCDAHWGLHQ